MTMEDWMANEITADPSTALPRISCRTWWRRRTSCGFLYGKPHTRPCPALRGRKSGYAPVGMTILLQGDGPKTVRRMAANGPTELSSRPKRSAVEGPAVSLPGLTQTLKPGFIYEHSREFENPLP